MEDEEEKKKICKTCRKRRSNSGGATGQNNQTVFIDEIVDKNGRAALIISCFGIEKWLEGDMIRTLFVTEAHGIEQEINYLGKVKQFKDEEQGIKQYFDDNKANLGEFKFARIKADIEALRTPGKDEKRAHHVSFLYDRRAVNGAVLKNRKIEETRETLERIKKGQPTINLETLLCAKTPTPSTILDVWNTTQDFYEEFRTSLISLGDLGVRNRLTIKSNEPINIQSEGGTLEAAVLPSGKKIELLQKDNSTFEVIGEIFESERSHNEWVNTTVRLIGTNQVFQVSECTAGIEFSPYRIITASPNFFAAIVPANKAVEISNQMHQKYMDTFGKVTGRLPYSIGNIFFPRDIPMFIVLDAARRMSRNFNKLSSESLNVCVKTMDHNPIRLTVEASVADQLRSYYWDLPTSLGNEDEDFYHPYMLIEKGKGSLKDRDTFFSSSSGDVIHFSKIQEEDTLTIYPNYYDFEYLDATIRRHDLVLDKTDRRLSSVIAIPSRPYFLEELPQRIMHLWKDLIKGTGLVDVTDTKIKNLQSLWSTKFKEWGCSDTMENEPAKQAWIDFVKASILKEFGPKHLGSLEKTLKDGTFFDTLDLFNGILKEKINE